MSTRPLKYVRHCWYCWRMNRKFSNLALRRKTAHWTMDVQFEITGKYGVI